LEKNHFKNAEESLERFSSDEDFLWAIRPLNEPRRLISIKRAYPEIMNWSNLERNYFLWRVNQIISIGICRYFKIIGEERRQYCCPSYKKDRFYELVMKMKKGEFNYSLEPLECTCDLTKVYGNCRKEIALSRV